jgi:DHA1 family tetracycline resistance protein-like MFS transporter
MLALPFYAEELGASATLLGGILSIYAAAQFLFAPLWGKLSDRYGRRPVLLFCVAGMGASLLWLGLAETLPAIFVARFVAGAFAANIGVASAYIADATSAEERTRFMGLLGACFGIGFVLGPALAGLLHPLGESLFPSRAAALPILVAAGLAAINLVWGFFALKEPERALAGGAAFRPDGGAAPASGASGGRLAVLREPGMRRLCLAWLIFSVGVTQLEATFAFFMIERFDYDLSQVAFIFVAMAVVMGAVQGGGMKRLAARYGERKLVASGTLVCAVAFVWVPLTSALTALLGALALGAIGRAVVQPSMMALTSTTATATSRGLAMGTFQSSGALARIFGPALAGWLFDQSASYPFFLAAGLFVLVSWVARGLPARAVEMDGEPAGGVGFA